MSAQPRTATGDLHGRVALRLAQVADSSCDRSEYERGTLDCLREALDFQVGFFVRDDTLGDARVGLCDGLVEGTRKRIAMYGRELAPVLEVALRRGLAVDREVLGAGLERTRLYREFIAPHQGHSTALVPLQFKGQTLGLLALGRQRRGFGENELAWLRSLLPVLRVCEASWGQPAAHIALTPRERDVLDYLWRVGNSNVG
jgi:hypothetical protein